MKTRYIFFALLTLTLGAHASFYNQTTQIEAGKLPKIVYTDTGYINQPTTDQLKAAGWLLKAVVPFVVPEGYQKIAGTRRIEVEGDTASEVYDIETNAEAEARAIAKQHADQAAKPQYQKNVEKKTKDLLVSLGFPVPVQSDTIIQMIDGLQAQVTALLADNKEKDAIRLMSTIDALTNLRLSLGEDIYSPFLGEGGVDE